MSLDELNDAVNEFEDMILPLTSNNRVSVSQRFLLVDETLPLHKLNKASILRDACANNLKLSTDRLRRVRGLS